MTSIQDHIGYRLTAGQLTFYNKSGCQKCKYVFHLRESKHMEKLKSNGQDPGILYGSYEELIKYAKIPMILINDDATIILCNRAFELLTGYSVDEIKGIKWIESIVDPSDHKMLMEYHYKRRTDTSSTPEEYEFILLARDGAKKNISISINMFTDTKKSIAFLQDITWKKQSENMRENLEEQLNQSSKLETIGQLTGGIAHDFNNMLAAIMGYSQLSQIRMKKFLDFFYKKKNESIIYPDHVSKEVRKNEKHPSGSVNMLPENSATVSYVISLIEQEIHNLESAYSMIEDVIRISQRAGGLTKQLLAFARKQTPERKPLDLNNLIISSEKMLRRTIRENIEIEICLSEDLGFTEADEGQVEQVILNLSLNAQDAMPSGGKLIITTMNINLDESFAVDNEGAIPGRYIMLKISDTGSGIDQITLKQIFEPFFTTKERGKGTGLGLATVYGIVKQHRGYISVKSEKGEGSEFCIYLLRSDNKPGRTEPPVSEKGSPGNETILIVEDQENVRRAISMMLSELGYNVLEAENGSKALDISRSYNAAIHILISDIVMPGMNGRVLYNELVKTRPDITSLFISGYPGEIISHKDIPSEDFNFLSKPVSFEKLSDKISELLERKNRMSIDPHPR